VSGPAVLITRAGYSIGIAFPPSWDEGYMLGLKQGDPTVLEEGMTFHLIPWMWGVDGNKTVGISDTIHVTKDGCQSFFTLDRKMVSKPREADKDPKPPGPDEAPSMPHPELEHPPGKPIIELSGKKGKKAKKKAKAKAKKAKAKAKAKAVAKANAKTAKKAATKSTAVKPMPKAKAKAKPAPKPKT